MITNQITVRGTVMSIDDRFDPNNSVFTSKMVINTHANEMTFLVYGTSEVGGMMGKQVGWLVTVIGQLEYKPDTEHPLTIKAMQVW